MAWMNDIVAALAHELLRVKAKNVNAGIAHVKALPLGIMD